MNFKIIYKKFIALQLFIIYVCHKLMDNIFINS